MIPVLRYSIPVVPWIIMVAGLVLIAWSALYFRLNKTPITPRRKPQVLLATGPYRINRNPIYTGMQLILVGFALYLGSVFAFIPVLAFPFLITERFIEGEEALLREAFGTEAETYIAGTRRW